jgi:hypothetical protein
MSTLPTRQRPISLPPQYSRDIVRSDGDAITGYVDGTKRRVDQTVAGMTTIIISRPDLGVMYRIEANTQTYSTIPITRAMEAVAGKDVEENQEWEHVTTEPFGSRVVDVFDVFLIGETHRRSRLYVDRETHIRWKEVTFNKLGKEVLVIEAKNVRVGPPPASVFELPAGLREVGI